MPTSATASSIGLLLLVVQGSAAAARGCPETPTPLGVMREAVGQGMRFTSTGEATTLVDSDEGRRLAQDEARLGAKAALNAEKGVPKTANGELQGVYDVRACEFGGKAYVTVALDTFSSAEAAELSAAMAGSAS